KPVINPLLVCANDPPRPPFTLPGVVFHIATTSRWPHTLSFTYPAPSSFFHNPASSSSLSPSIVVLVWSALSSRHCRALVVLATRCYPLLSSRHRPHPPVRVVGLALVHLSFLPTRHPPPSPPSLLPPHLSAGGGCYQVGKSTICGCWCWFWFCLADARVVGPVQAKVVVVVRRNARRRRALLICCCLCVLTNT
ncbi:hypothetical protein CPC08DRAFT_824802, partial [Agrocybe pediades]